MSDDSFDLDGHDAEHADTSHDNIAGGFLPLDGHVGPLISTILAGGNRSFEVCLRERRTRQRLTVMVRAPNRVLARDRAIRAASWRFIGTPYLEVIGERQLAERFLWDVFLTGRPHALPRSPVAGRAHLIGRVVATNADAAAEAALEAFGVDDGQWRTCNPQRFIGPEDEIEVRAV
ncbi:hypothetical protein VAR608DRAFT_5694 [Variovorax sp. HW608]|uniref:hypothetical protein n=1 Tax=Variovorax sp. HW608 TaxID=1034889 RepID=UPI00081FD8B0|nr:hypothetical protein [Variovorax sp. HW608]SCK55317.1 hypothetical protein VAR608DRAFT_5694 [Variovorax sp. HW608]